MWCWRTLRNYQPQWCECSPGATLRVFSSWTINSTKLYMSSLFLSILENIQWFIYCLICCKKRSTLHFFFFSFSSSYLSCIIIYSQVSEQSQQSAPSSLPQIKMWQKGTVGALIMGTGIWSRPGDSVQLTSAWWMKKAIGWQSGVWDVTHKRNRHARVWVAPFFIHTD